MLGEQGVGQDARGDGPGLLSQQVIILAFRPLNDLVGLLTEVKAGAAAKKGQRDRRGDQLRGLSAYDRLH